MDFQGLTLKFQLSCSACNQKKHFFQIGPKKFQYCPQQYQPACNNGNLNSICQLESVVRLFVALLMLAGGLFVAGGASADVLLDNTNAGTALLVNAGFLSWGGVEWGLKFSTGSQQKTISSIKMAYFTTTTGSNTVTVSVYLVPQGANLPANGQTPDYSGTVTVTSVVGAEYFEFTPSSSWTLLANSNYVLTYTTTLPSRAATPNPRNVNYSGSAGYTATIWAQNNNGVWSGGGRDPLRSMALYLQGSGSPPTATTNAATSVTATGATLNGTVNDNGESTTVTFNYGTTVVYGSTANASQSPISAGTGSTAVSATLTGLTCNTTYHFQVSATNSVGTTNGSDATFTTSACAVAVPTLSEWSQMLLGLMVLTMIGWHFHKQRSY